MDQIKEFNKELSAYSEIDKEMKENRESYL